MHNNTYQRCTLILASAELQNKRGLRVFSHMTCGLIRRAVHARVRARVEGVTLGVWWTYGLQDREACAQDLPLVFIHPTEIINPSNHPINEHTPIKPITTRIAYMLVIWLFSLLISCVDSPCTLSPYRGNPNVWR